MTTPKHPLNRCVLYPIMLVCLYMWLVVLALVVIGCTSTNDSLRDEHPRTIDSLDLEMPAYFGPFFFD